jgi:penicillin-binding protein 2
MEPHVWKKLSGDPHYPLINKALSGLYAPGSLIKMGIILAAFRQGIITPRTTVHCTGQHTVGKHIFHCWRRGGHGTVDAVAALAQSCDQFFYTLAHQINPSVLHRTLRDLGMGESLLPEFPEAKVGNLSNPTEPVTTGSDKNGKKKVKSWLLHDTILMCIGQGALTTTLLHMATMTARLATGRHVMPTVTYNDAAKKKSRKRTFFFRGSSANCSPRDGNSRDTFHGHSTARGIKRSI